VLVNKEIGKYRPEKISERPNNVGY